MKHFWLGIKICYPTRVPAVGFEPTTFLPVSVGVKSGLAHHLNHLVTEDVPVLSGVRGV